MKVTMEFEDYKPWGGAEETYRKVEEANQLEALEQLVEDSFGELVNQTRLNDFLWFNNDYIYASLGIDPN